MEGVLVQASNLVSVALPTAIVYENFALVQPSLWFFFHPWHAPVLFLYDL